MARDARPAARRDRPQRLPRDHGHLAVLDASFGYPREFAPQVLAGGGTARVGGRPPAARRGGRARNAGGARKVPDDAPVGFVPARWAGYLQAAKAAGDANAYRHCWELVVLLELRDALRSGDVWVPGSRRYADPATYLMPAGRWRAQRAEFCSLAGVPGAAGEALARGGQELAAALDRLEPALAAGDGPVRLTGRGELLVGRLSAEDVPGGLGELRDTVLGLLPRVPLASLLLEVDRDTGFSDHLVHAGSAQHRGPRLRRDLYAAVLAQACNLGLAGMAATSGISYDTLAWHTDWYLREETLVAAGAAVVNAQHRLPLAGVWGAGELSSSDGQRFPVRGASLTARSLSRYFLDTGITTYTHVSDQHATYGTKVVPATDREAVHVLDDILGNPTDLTVREHAVDTAGQTLSVFALFALEGLVLSPRIRDLGAITLHRLGARKELLARWPHAGPLLTATVNTRLIGSSGTRCCASRPA